MANKRGRFNDVCHFGPETDSCSGDDIVVCPLNKKHSFCTFHADVICGINAPNNSEQMINSILSFGCPLCTGVCPCPSCCKARGEVPFLGPRRGTLFSDKLSSSKRHEVIASNYVVHPIRIDIEDFNEDQYEQVVLRERRVIVLEGSHRKRLPASVFDLKKICAAFENDGTQDVCPPGAEMQVRIQGVDDNDVGAFVVLDEINNCHPKWFIHQTMDGGKYSGGAPGKIYRTLGSQRCVLYCKDWNFPAYKKEWEDVLMEAIPPRLQPYGEHDILGALTGRAQIQTLMAYVGSEGTRTPLHTDKVASIAFNCLVWAEDEENTKKLWWLFHPEDHDKLDEYLRRTRGFGCMVMDDNHWIDPYRMIRDLKSVLRHPVTYVEQRQGDMLIVPPESPHFVLNRGGLSFAVAANVMEAKFAQHSLRVERKNQSLKLKSIYKVRGAIWAFMMNQCKKGRVTKEVYDAACEVYKDEEELLNIFVPILDPAPHTERKKACKYLNQTTCDICLCDIFNGQTIICRGIGRIFCLECTKQQSMESLYLCIPIPLADLKKQLDEAASYVVEK